MAKIAVIGAGHVGATAAQMIAEKSLADVVLVDIADGLAAGKSLDMMHALSVKGISVTVQGTNDFKEIAGSQIIVITAGFPRGPGMSRTDLLAKNATVMRSVVDQLNKHTTDPIVITVTNPLDVMTTLCYRLSGLDRFRVIGMGGVLDSARFTYVISQRLAVSLSQVKAMVVGTHGDSMLPLPGVTEVAGKKLTDLLDQAEIDKIIERTKGSGAEVISYLKSGSAFYGPAASVTKMIEVVLTDKKSVLPCSVYLEGEYEISGVSIGVPVVLGSNGVERIETIDMTTDESEALQKSAAAIQESLVSIGAE